MEVIDQLMRAVMAWQVVHHQAFQLCRGGEKKKKIGRAGSSLSPLSPFYYAFEILVCVEFYRKFRFQVSAVTSRRMQH